MLKSAFLALSLTASVIATSQPAFAQTETTAVPVDPARLKAAEIVVMKLVPPGTYQKIMKDMTDTMASGIMEQILGMDAATLAGMAGEDAAGAEKGKSMAEIAAEKDPHFRERMDIMMKVMFTEMGTLMGEMEPEVRKALSSIYAKKYSLTELNDIGAFFATPSGASFAGNFMSTFTDKEMMQASFGMMPKIMEAMPAIMKKVEEATAHLPPPPQPSSDDAAEAAAETAA